MSALYVKPLATVARELGTASTTPQDILLSGAGLTTMWLSFKSANANVTSGIWVSDAFSKKKSHPDEMEFCYLIEGRVKLTDTQGNSSVFNAGEAFIVEPGFDGIWESETPVRKYFVIAKCG